MHVGQRCVCSLDVCTVSDTHHTSKFVRAFTAVDNDQFSMICIFYTLIVPIVFVSELSTSVKTLQYDLKKSDISKSGNRKLFFDTHAMVRLLEESGKIAFPCF